jgi:hypothetical protein
MSTPTQVADFLENLNAWRRGDEAIEMPSPYDIGCAIESAVKLLREHEELERRAERAEAELKRYTDAVNAQPWATDEPIRVLLDRVTMLWASEKQAKIERGDMLCGCQDQLRAERDWLKTWQDQAETNYVIGEPLAKKLRDTEAERDELRGALALGQQNCDDAYDDLRAERDQLRAEVEELKESILVQQIFSDDRQRAVCAEADLAAERARLDDLVADIKDVCITLESAIADCDYYALQNTEFKLTAVRDVLLQYIPNEAMKEGAK